MLLAALLLAWPPPAAQEPGAAPRDLARALPTRVLGPLPGLLTAEDPTGAEARATMRLDEHWPTLDGEYLGADGKLRRWEGIAEKEGWLDLNELRGGPHAPSRRALLYRPYVAARVVKMTLRIGSDGPLQIWCNGVEVYRSEDARGLDAAPHRVSLALEEGLNHILIQTLPGAEDWRLRTRVEELVYSEWPEVDRAIDRGVAYLLARQLPDGSWPDFVQVHPAAMPALSAYTLLNCGLAPDHPAVQRALARARTLEPGGTYAMGIMLMALAAGGDPQDKELIERHAATLRRWSKGGLWAYPSGEVDLSNTQYAALGLRAAAAAGVEVPAEIWKSIVRGVARCESMGGYSYRPGGSGTNASMTAAGVGTLAICREQLALQGVSSRGLDRSIERGITWLGNNCYFDGAPPISVWGYYAVYGMERAGSLAGVERFGAHEWYREGAEWLLAQQFVNGSWQQAAGTSQPDLLSCFALLFLRRASAMSPVAPVTAAPVSGEPGTAEVDGPFLSSSRGAGPLQLRVSLRAPRRLWLATDSPVYEDLERVVYWVQPPDGLWQRMDGDRAAHWAVPFAFEPAGRWAARASGFLDDGSDVESGVIEFTVSEAKGTAQSATDAAALTEDLEALRLALRARPVERVTASSNVPGGMGMYAGDGDLSSGWRCAADDAEPKLVIDLHRRSKVSRLWIAHPPMLNDELLPRVLVARVEVRIGDAPPVILELPDDSAATARLDLEEPQSADCIRLRILELHRGRLGEASVGIGEALLD